jgi:hypothetical protein
MKRGVAHENDLLLSRSAQTGKEGFPVKKSLMHMIGLAVAIFAKVSNYFC